MGKALDDLIAGFGKSSGAPAPHTCAAVWCKALILPYALFCDECWRKCPSDLKRLIGKHHRPGKKPSQVLTKWVAQAVAELLYLKTEGHHIPRDGSFMWDDEPAAATAPSGDLFEGDDAGDKS